MEKLLLSSLYPLMCNVGGCCVKACKVVTMEVHVTQGNIDHHLHQAALKVCSFLTETSDILS